MGDKKNEKFMNFGPEWLQNLSNDPPSGSISQRGTYANTAASTSSSSTSTTTTLRPSNTVLQLAQFRYGREEMLALFDANVSPPNGLSQHSELYVSSTQLPIALQADTPNDANRRGWITSNRGFNSATSTSAGLGLRMTGRNIPGDRTRPRDGRPFIQQDFFSNRRTFYHTNTGRGGTRPPHSDLPPSRIMDRNRELAEGESTRRDFNAANRWNSDANWRRINKNNEEEEGWRAANDHNRARYQYQDKRLSWRDEDGSRENREGRYERDRERDFNDRTTDKRERPAWNTQRSWNTDNSSADDLLPEWANSDNLVGHSGSFDSTGAFLGGSSNDEKEDEDDQSNVVLGETIHQEEDAGGMASGVNSSVEENYEVGPMRTSPHSINIDQVIQDSIDMSVKNKSILSDLPWHLDMIPRPNENFSEPPPSLPPNLIKPLRIIENNEIKIPQEVNKTVNHSDRILSDIEKMLKGSDDDRMMKNPILGNMLQFGSLPETAIQSNSLFENLDEGRPEMPSFLQPIQPIQPMQQIQSMQQMQQIQPIQPIRQPPVDELSRNNGNRIDNQFVQNIFCHGSVDSATPNETAPPIATNFRSQDSLMDELVQSLVLDDDEEPIVNKNPLPAVGQPMNIGQHMMPKNLPPGVGLPHNRMIVGRPMNRPHNRDEEEDWFYRDPQGDIQGPFTASEMKEWFETGYFVSTLQVCRTTNFHFATLGVLIKYCGGHIPFLLPQKVIDSIFETVMKNGQGENLEHMQHQIAPRYAHPPMPHEMQIREQLQLQQQQQQQHQHQQQQLQHQQLQQHQLQAPLMNMVNPGSIPSVQFGQSNDMINHNQMVNDFLGENQWQSTQSGFPWREPNLPQNRGQMPNNMTPLLMPVNMNQSAGNIPMPGSQLPLSNPQPIMPPPHIPMPPSAPQSIWDLQNSASSSNILEREQMQPPPLAHSMSMPTMLQPPPPLPQHIYHLLQNTQVPPPPLPQQLPINAQLPPDFHAPGDPILHDKAILSAVISKPNMFDVDPQPVVSSVADNIKEKTDKKKKVPPETKKKSEGNNANKKKDDEKKVESPKLKRKGKNKEIEKEVMILPNMSFPPPRLSVPPPKLPPSMISGGAIPKDMNRYARSIAPWAANKEMTLENMQNMSLSDIQRFERERKFEENREFIPMFEPYEAEKEHHMDKKPILKLKWADDKANTPMKVMSLAEIQAEEQSQLAKLSANKMFNKDHMMIPMPNSGTASWGAAPIIPPNSDSNWWNAPGDNGFWDQGGAAAAAAAKNKTIEKPQASNTHSIKPQVQKPNQPIKVEPVVRAVTKMPPQKKDTTESVVHVPAPAPVPVSAVPKLQPKTDALEEFLMWSKMTAYSINSEIDSTVFVNFLRHLEAPYEVKEYVKFYLGETKESHEFARQFIEKRSKLLVKRVSAPVDDLCGPAAAINPALLPSDFSDSKNKNKKNKKNKMLRIDASILGFNSTAATDRFNVGDIDMA